MPPSVRASEGRILWAEASWELLETLCLLEKVPRPGPSLYPSVLPLILESYILSYVLESYPDVLKSCILQSYPLS